MLKFEYVIISLFLLLFVGCSQTSIAVVNEPLDVNIQDYNGEIVLFYVAEEKQLTTLDSIAAKGSFNILVDDSSGCVIGDAVDLWDNTQYFQGIITDVTGNNISFISQLNTNFNIENTVVKCGNWKLNVDGSTTKKIFYLNPPSNVSWDIESLGITFTDNADHDFTTFGSRNALTNGFTGGIKNGEFKRFFLIVNNAGFKEHGFDYDEIDKAPSGSYGFYEELLFEKKFGAIPKLMGNMSEKIVFNVNDDLTSQEAIVLTVRGHYKTD